MRATTGASSRERATRPNVISPRPIKPCYNLWIMRYDEDIIRRISQAARPETLLPAPPGALEQGRQIANAYFDTYTDEEWRVLLGKLQADQAAGVISHRSAEDRRRLLMLIPPDRRAEVRRFLATAAA